MTAFADEIASLYDEAARDLSAWLRDGTDFQRGRAAHLLAQVDRVMARTGRRVVDAIDRAVEQTYRKELDATSNQLRRIGLSASEVPIRGFFDRINERAVAKLAGETRRDLLDATKQLGDRAKRAIRKTAQRAVADPEVSRAVAKGLIAGGSIRVTTKSLAQMFSEGEARRLVAEHKIPVAEAAELTRVNDGYIQAGKVPLPIKHYAETVALTRLAEAQTLATEDRCEQAGVDFVIIVGPSTEDFCDFFVGRVFSLSGDSPDYPSIAQLPGGGTPFHPRCTHREAPFIVKFATPAELKRGADVDRSLLGLDPQRAAGRYRALADAGDAPKPRAVSGMNAAKR